MSEGDSRFDFDEWMQLAKTDPAAFDARRRQVIEALINDAPPHIRQRLLRFQWRIDMERARCENPMQACIKLSNMMWDLVYGDRGFLWSLKLLSDPNPAASAVGGAASVVPFKAPGDACSKPSNRGASRYNGQETSAVWRGGLQVCAT